MAGDIRLDATGYRTESGESDTSAQFRLAERYAKDLKKMKTASLTSHLQHDIKGPNTWAGRFLRIPGVETIIIFLILLNLVTTIISIDRSADKDSSVGSGIHWTDICSWLILAIFVIELLLRMIESKTKFLDDNWNRFDFVAIVMDLLGSILAIGLGQTSSVSAIRVIRLAKLARATKSLSLFTELRQYVYGFMNTMSALFWGIVLILLSLVLWGMAAVVLLHPLNKNIDYGDCDRCSRAYSSVAHASLTFFQQIIAGDSWGLATIPLIEEQPSTAIFFGACFFCEGVLITNLILGIVVNVAQTAKERVEADDAARMQLQELQFITDLVKAIDLDGDQKISYDEFLGAYHEIDVFREGLTSLGIREDTIRYHWEILDLNMDGRISYKEFITHLLCLRGSDEQVMTAFIKNKVTQIADTLEGCQQDARHGPEGSQTLTFEAKSSLRSESARFDKMSSCGGIGGIICQLDERHSHLMGRVESLFQILGEDRIKAGTNHHRHPHATPPETDGMLRNMPGPRAVPENIQPDRLADSNHDFVRLCSELQANISQVDAILAKMLCQTAIVQQQEVQQSTTSIGMQLDSKKTWESQDKLLHKHGTQIYLTAVVAEEDTFDP